MNETTTKIISSRINTTETAFSRLTERKEANDQY